MNAPEPFLLPDVQSATDSRALAIDRVGIRGLVAPMHVSTPAGGCLATVVTAEMCVHLPADSKGTHMSRFLEILQSHPEALDMTSVRHLMARMLERLGALAGSIDLAFPYFVSKRAPVSGVSSLMDYQVRMVAEVDLDGSDAFTLQVTVPVTSLCPCSKEISDYGAHNQRSHITIRARLDGEMSVEELVRLAEDEASCELFGLLKRPDEKWVTERAYDNPKFVEDLVRDIALRLDADARIAGYVVESENFESIHNHSAYARIERDRRTARR